MFKIRIILLNIFTSFLKEMLFMAQKKALKEESFRA
jgi:hypothetical protein